MGLSLRQKDKLVSIFILWLYLPHIRTGQKTQAHFKLCLRHLSFIILSGCVFECVSIHVHF